MLSQHEAVCAERYGNLSKTVEKIELGLEGLKKTNWALLVSLLGFMAALIVKIAIK